VGRLAAQMNLVSYVLCDGSPPTMERLGAPDHNADPRAQLVGDHLTGVSDHGAVTAGTGSATAAMVIEIPELAVPMPTLAPCDTAKSPGSARLRSTSRLWSFGRQGAGATSSCYYAGAGANEGVWSRASASVTIAFSSRRHHCRWNTRHAADRPAGHLFSIFILNNKKVNKLRKNIFI